jgi:Uma2 family endonuclease
MATKTSTMATTARPATEEDLLRAPEDGYKHELVDGAIRMSPAGSRHGLVSLRLASRLLAFVAQQRQGYVFDSSTGFRMPSGKHSIP